MVSIEVAKLVTEAPGLGSGFQYAGLGGISLCAVSGDMGNSIPAELGGGSGAGILAPIDP